MFSAMKTEMLVELYDVARLMRTRFDRWARAYGMTGDVMAEDGLCTHQPGTMAVPEAPDVEYGAVETAAAGVDGTVEWDTAARARMKEIPAFVRGMVSRRVETYCRDHGIARITPEILAELRAKMPTPKLFGGRS
jgi:hypothetical protein